jgi:hypothetical protein
VTNRYSVAATGFPITGVPCGAYLYLHEHAQNPSLVVMVHGFGAERTFRLPAYATLFAGNEIALLLFDHERSETAKLHHAISSIGIVMLTTGKQQSLMRARSRQSTVTESPVGQFL